MMKLLSFVLQIAALAALAIWLADRPGTAHIVWHGTVIDTSAAFLGFCVLVLAYILHLLMRLWHFLRHGPALWRMRRKMTKLQQGQEQITQGLIAIASGNAADAGKLAVAARKNLGASAATQWLQAQAAQMAGDTRAAQAIFRQLAASPDAAVLGYRGLIAEAKRNGHWDEIDRLAVELQRAKPGTPWLALIRMESAARRGQWDEAETALGQAAKARLLESGDARRTRATLHIAASREALAAQDHDGALRAAEQASQQAPDWLPAQLNLAETLAATRHERAARRAIERGWRQNPHPQLAEILRGLSADRLDAFKQTEKLCRDTETAFESRMAMAEAAIAADVWGEARRHLQACLNDGTATQNTYRMLARLEKRERGDERAAASWLMKAVEAPIDTQWICGECGGAFALWRPVCTHCGAFESIEWRRPGQRRAVLSFQGNADD
ncbi:MAG: hypothetical protein KGI97_00260 [Alphaproteobacteria bacterium]|nr:hypothetical protein [Alphaproteobacteria bacterium]